MQDPFGNEFCLVRVLTRAEREALDAAAKHGPAADAYWRTVARDARRINERDGDAHGLPTPVRVIRTRSSGRRAIRYPSRSPPRRRIHRYDQHGSRGCDLAQGRKLPIASIFRVDQLNPILPAV